jgi:hypothetical protein
LKSHRENRQNNGLIVPKMLPPVPQEFRTPEVGRAFGAARHFERDCPAAASVLRYQLFEGCQEIAQSRPISPEARAWLQQIQATVPADPMALLPQATVFAKQSFQTLETRYRQEPISMALSTEFKHLGTLLDLFEDEECERLARRAKIAAAKITQLFFLRKSGVRI